MSTSWEVLSLKDKSLVDGYLKGRRHRLASYAFENLIIWSPLFELRRTVTNGKLCIFFKNAAGCFMILPPLGGLDFETVSGCFEIMEGLNRNKDISRIENIEEEEADFFRKRGFRVYEKNREYVVRREDIAQYHGTKFRHQRYLKRFFGRDTSFCFRDYRAADKEAVLALAGRWALERRAKCGDAVYRAMLDDSSRVLAFLLEHLAELDIVAKVVEADGDIRAFSSGFAVSPSIFCVNFEIAELRYKGLPQYVFSEFAASVSSHEELNLMDDSGIENLKRTKLAFHPRPLVSYTALMNP